MRENSKLELRCKHYFGIANYDEKRLRLKTLNVFIAGMILQSWSLRNSDVLCCVGPTSTGHNAPNQRRIHLLVSLCLGFFSWPVFQFPVATISGSDWFYLESQLQWNTYNWYESLLYIIGINSQHQCEHCLLISPPADIYDSRGFIEEVDKGKMV